MNTSITDRISIYKRNANRTKKLLEKATQNNDKTSIENFEFMLHRWEVEIERLVCLNELQVT